MSQIKTEKAPCDMHSSQKRHRYHNVMLVQQLQYLVPPFDTFGKLMAQVGEIGPESYAGIIHDKDTGSAPHLHIFMHFANAREINAIAKQLQIAPERIQKWDDNSDNGFAYLIHRTPKAQDDGAYQYDPCEVQADFDYNEWLQNWAVKRDKAKKAEVGSAVDIDYLLDCLYTGVLSLEEAEKLLSGSQYAHYHKQLSDVWAKRLQNLAAERQMERKAKGQPIEVIWIYGEASTGKTRFAKEQASKLDKHYFITGSSRDPFQQYTGQNVVIYDEARPNSIPFPDLLKLLDPYGEDTAAPSRYYDKPVSASWYFITSPYSPIEFYKKIIGEHQIDNIDRFDQLLRRLSLVIYMNQNYIQAMQFDPESDTFIPLSDTRRPNQYSQTPAKPSTSSIELFNSLMDT